MSICVLGSNGMLGHKMTQHLVGRFPGVWGTVRGPVAESPAVQSGILDGSILRGEVDAMDSAALRALLRQEKPDWIINCVGVIKQRAAAKSAIPSIAVNALLPHLLAEWASEWGGRVIHFSTDCVFSGNGGPYAEQAPSDAEDLYGKTKFLGETAAPNSLTLRTSIIGRELSQFQSLLEWSLSQHSQGVGGFRKVIYSGVTTNFLSRLVGDIIEQHPDLSGLYQVSSEPIPKYDLLCLISDRFGLGLEVTAVDEPVSDRSMDGERFLAETGFVVPGWPQLIDELVADETSYDAVRARE